MTAMRITLGHLYPDLMSTYGDRGNVETIVRRCGWRGIAADVRELGLSDRIRPDELDLIVIGSGGESRQALVAPDLSQVKGPGIREAVEQGAAALAVGTGYELLGHFCQPGEGPELPGVGLFDAWTVRRGVALGGHGTVTEARAGRAIGELLVRWGDTLLVGFENHSGDTYLGPKARPLGDVICGYGNCGDGREGARLGNAVGTHLRGPCLPKNPQLADFLISAALVRRRGEAWLPPLPDELEQAAQQAAIWRAQQAARGRAGTLVGTMLHRYARRPASAAGQRRMSAGPRLRRDQKQRADGRAEGPAGDGASERDLRSGTGR
jgi:lipid II isoglutaminyl synthase (glutamine-hydrolysing)